MSAVQRDSKLAREIKDADFRPGKCHFVLTMPQKDDSASVHEAPRFVWGIVDPRATAGRETPPDIDIFPTEKSFFDIGHLMALELGGSDDQKNLIPQFREQNQHAEWRQMESKLRQDARSAWDNKLRNTFMHVAVQYDPAGGLVPNGMEVSVYEIQAADLAKPEVVEQWHPNPPPTALQQWKKLFTNKLSDQDLVNTGIRGVHGVRKRNDAHWTNYMLGKVLNGIQEDESLSIKQKRAVETEALADFFDTSGAKLSKRQKMETDVARASHKAATKRTLVSATKREALEQMAAFEGGLTTEVPGTGSNWDLPKYTSHFGKGGNEPIRRRSSSPEPPDPSKRKLQKLQNTVEAAKKRVKLS